MHHANFEDLPEQVYFMMVLDACNKSTAINIDNTTSELKADGLQYYQELIGVLRWAVEIGRLDILLEVSLMSAHLALPRQGHLE